MSADQPATDVEVSGASIRLGQLLKLSGVAESGAAAAALLAAGEVRVDGEVETRRGRQLDAGAVVDAGGQGLRVVAAAPG